MKGQVDGFGRLLVKVAVQASDNANLHIIDAWIDTGFNGDLVLPQHLIEKMNLLHSGTVKAILADGSEAALKTYSCEIDWFGKQRHLEVVANSGEYPLLGGDYYSVTTCGLAIVPQRLKFLSKTAHSSNFIQ